MPNKPRLTIILKLNVYLCCIKFYRLRKKLYCALVYVMLCILLFKVILIFKSVVEILVCDHSNTSRIEQFFHVVQFTLLYRGVSDFKISKWNHRAWPFIETLSPVLSCRTVKYRALQARQCTLKYCVVFHTVVRIMLYKVILTFKSVDKTLVCDHSNESYCAVLSFGSARSWNLSWFSIMLRRKVSWSANHLWWTHDCFCSHCNQIFYNNKETLMLGLLEELFIS